MSNLLRLWIFLSVLYGVYSKVLVVLLSQTETYHVAQTQRFKDDFQEQLKNIETDLHPKLLVTSEHFIQTHGAWTVLNLIEPLKQLHEKDSFDWVFMCEEDTRLNVKSLLELLSTYDHNLNYFLGRGLRDKTPTIIHHFAFFKDASKFAYPDFGAGFAFSVKLLNGLYERINTDKLKTDFSIDVKHELALFIWNDGNGTALTNIKDFCMADESNEQSCITYQPLKFPDCGDPIEKDNLFVAVKTCEKFHSTRLQVVKATWAKQAHKIEYYSETEDPDIPTINIGIPNTERGHCGKTMAIIRRVLETQHRSRPWWILIADDDTIINLDRLRSLLACYSHHREPVALGERYGFGLFRGRGYDYITGGGGMVFNLAAISLLGEQCVCYADDAPDDMTLGMCLRSIGIPVTHSRYFHQARPEDYSEAFLSNQHPVSFHKHWETDPYKVFDRISKPIEIHSNNNKQGHIKTNHLNKEEL